MLNNGFLMGSESIIPDHVNNKSYDGFKFNGNCTIDSICVQNYEKTDVEVLATSVSNLPNWTPDMLFLAKFDNSLDGSNVFGIVGTPMSWSLYRREYQGDILTKVIDCAPNVMSWQDYKCEGNKNYEWLIFCNTSSQVSEPIVTDKVHTDSFGYFLISSDADFTTSADPTNLTPLIANDTDMEINNDVEVFEFNLNLTSDKVTKNNDVTMLKNYSKYDKIVVGNRCFRSGTFTSTLIPFYENSYDFEGLMRWQNYLDELDVFLSDKGYKYLVNRSGSIMCVSTHGSGSDYDLQYTEDNAIGENNQLNSVVIYYNEVKNV